MTGICMTPGCGQPKLPGRGYRYCADCKAASLLKRVEHEVARNEARREAKAEYMRRRRHEYPDTERERQRASYQKHAEARREYARQHWLIADKAAIRETKRQWEKANPEKVRAAQRRWAQKNPEKIRERGQRYYLANAEICRERGRQWRRSNQELNRQIKRRWGQQNAATVREYSRRRRAMERAALITGITAEQWDAWAAYWGDQCWLRIPGICEGTANSVDHVIPLARGGPHCLANLRPACRPCNSSKKASDWRKYVSRRSGAAA